MKNLKLFTTVIVLFLSIGIVVGQDSDRLSEVQELSKKEAQEGWNTGMGVGLDFFQLLQLNPQVGAGENRIQFGGVGSIYANYLKGRFSWDNSMSLLFGVQKLGIGTAKTIAYQKTIDELRLNSFAAYKTSDDSKWAYSVDFTFLSQLTPTYFGNYLSDVNTTDEFDGPISKFFSPAQISLSPGMTWMPNSHFSLLISPASIKLITVADDAIASIPGDEDLGIGLHGTEWNSSTDYKNTLFQFGATVKAKYSNKYFNDKIIHTSELTLFSNYLHNPQNIDIDFRNQIAYEIWKGLQLTFTLNFLYDDDIPVQISDSNAPNGIALNQDGTPKLGKRLNMVETFAIKYNIVF